jgi:4-amino-4-deoxy-L-arabinose transferase-like glycosyltransferase
VWDNTRAIRDSSPTPVAEPAPRATAPTPAGPRPLWPWLLIIAAGAFGVRLLYIDLIARAPVGIGGDAGFYQSAAAAISHGHFYYRTIFGYPHVTAEHPPLYPLVLSLGSLLGAGTTITAYRVLSCVIGAIAVAAIALLGERLNGRRTAVAAGAMAAVYPPFVTADGLVMSEPLFTLTVAIGLLAALALHARPTAARAAALGLSIGLATLTRSEGLLLLPLLGWPAAWGPRTGRIARTVTVTALAALTVAPWVIRNEVVFHRLILATDSNTLIAGANCHDTYYGRDIGWWSMRCLQRSRTLGQLLTGDAHTNQAVAYAEAHIQRLPLVAAVRVLRTFDLFQPLRQGNLESRVKWVDIAGLCVYFPLLLLSILGLRRVSGGTTAVLLAPVWLVVLTSAAGWGIGRFRIAADVTIVVLAALALTRGMQQSAAWRTPTA